MLSDLMNPNVTYGGCDSSIEMFKFQTPQVCAVCSKCARCPGCRFETAEARFFFLRSVCVVVVKQKEVTLLELNCPQDSLTSARPQVK